MPVLSREERIRLGLQAASGHMFQQDKIWSRHSNDKIDIAQTLTRVLRTLSKSLPLEKAISALSIGSSNEPQFRVLESAFRGGLYLLDIEDAAMQVVEERIHRQKTSHVRTIRGDYQQVLRDAESVRQFHRQHLSGDSMSLVTLHHSLYYSPQTFWPDLLCNLYMHVLDPSTNTSPSSAIHAVLMASHSDDDTTTTWLYNHYAERFFGCRNDQDLIACANQLRTDPRMSDAQILTKSSRVEFFVDDFEQFMAVVWMILLHPNVHAFSEEQQTEVIEWVYGRLWSQSIPLVQIQDHLVVYKGTGLTGLC
jgi:hypothetical protein